MQNKLETFYHLEYLRRRCSNARLVETKTRLRRLSVKHNIKSICEEFDKMFKPFSATPTNEVKREINLTAGQPDSSEHSRNMLRVPREPKKRPRRPSRQRERLVARRDRHASKRRGRSGRRPMPARRAPGDQRKSKAIRKKHYDIWNRAEARLVYVMNPDALRATMCFP